METGYLFKFISLRATPVAPVDDTCANQNNHMLTRENQSRSKYSVPHTFTIYLKAFVTKTFSRLCYRKSSLAKLCLVTSEFVLLIKHLQKKQVMNKALSYLAAIFGLPPTSSEVFGNLRLSSKNFGKRQISLNDLFCIVWVTRKTTAKFWFPVWN